MQPPALPPDEDARLAVLRALDVLDTAPEAQFDRVTRLARALFDVPMALVSLVDADRQWFKSIDADTPLGVAETPRDVSFCGHAILDDAVLVIPDARADPRFADNPLVTGPPAVRFYAGCPLTVSGRRIGTLCLLDTRPRDDATDATHAGRVHGARERALHRDLAAVVERELALRAAVTADALTGLLNRRGFEAQARQVLTLCRRLRLRAALLYIDLDGFKLINDCFGHAEGDRALRAFARQLTGALRGSDIAARLGGDEFAVLLPGADPAQQAAIVERIAQRLCAFNDAGDACLRGWRLACSMGAVEFDALRHDDIGQWLAEADARMYAHKQRKRSRAGPFRDADPARGPDDPERPDASDAPALPI